MRFRDSKDIEWIVRLNVGLIEKVHIDAGVDMDEWLKNPENIAEVLGMNPRKLVQILYVLCEEQIKERHMTGSDFGRLFDRDTLDKAGNALIEAFVDFYPRSSAGKTIREHLPRLIQKMDQEIIKKVNDELSKL